MHALAENVEKATLPQPWLFCISQLLQNLRRMTTG